MISRPIFIFMAGYQRMSDAQIIKHHARQALPLVYGDDSKLDRRLTLIDSVKALEVRQEAEAGS